jgi:hypothetical protein
MSALYFSVSYSSVFFVISCLFLQAAYLALCLVSRCRHSRYPILALLMVLVSTQNLASVAWEIYAPTDELISLHGIFLGRATNNIVEYSVVIELLTDAISFGILSSNCTS